MTPRLYGAPVTGMNEKGRPDKPNDCRAYHRRKRGSILPGTYVLLSTPWRCGNSESGTIVKKLIIFDLDGTLAESKASRHLLIR
jgi:hypothetical protein